MVQLLLHLALPLEQRVHFVVRHLFTKLGVDLFKLFQQIDSLLYGLFHNFAYRSRIVYQRFLLQIADRIARRENGLAVELLVRAGNDPQQRRFTRTVQAEHADLCTIKEREINVLEDSFLVVKLTDFDHRKDDLVWFSAHELKSYY